MLAIVAGTLLNCLCFVALLHLPWALIYIPVSEGSWKMIVPVRVGLVECFSDACIFDALVHNTEDPSAPIRFDPEITERFILVHRIVLGLLVLACTFSIVHSALIVCGCSAKMHSFEAHGNNAPSWLYLRYLYAVSVCCNILALFIYCGFTMWFLNGGLFLEGTMLLVVSIMIGIFCCLELFLDAYRLGYHPIPYSH